MKVPKRKVITRLKGELKLLEHVKEQTPEPEKNFVTGVMANLEKDLEHIRSARTMEEFLEEEERITAENRLIELINDLDLQIHDLEQVTKDLSTEYAAESVERFFITCQRVENVLKYSGIKRYASAEQIKELKKELQQKVNKMIRLSRRSEILNQALQQSRTAKAVLA